MLSKMTFDAFLTPAIVLVISLPRVLAVLQCIFNYFCPGKEFRWTWRGDVELSYVMLFFETALIFTFMMPLMLLFTIIALGLNCAVYHCAITQLSLHEEEAVRPSFQYLYWARAIGAAYLMWFFIDNDLHGQLLVCIGLPVSVVAGDFLAYQLLYPAVRSTPATLSELEIPLLDENECLTHNSD